MKASTSSLNPYAASYIPLSRRGVADENKGYELNTNLSKSGNAFWMRSHLGNTIHGQYETPSQSYNIHGAVSDDSKLKAHSAYGSYGSLSQYPNEVAEKQTLDEESDEDLAFLQMTFPNVSDESLFEVYLANKGDLDATVDMLNHLECSADSSQNLPDSLDIGDVSEFGLSIQKLKNVQGEFSGSTSGSGTQPLST